MLEFILTQTKLEEDEAHKAETNAQHEFEDEMQGLKEEAASLQESLINNKQLLAEKEQQLKLATQELKAAKEEKKRIEAYLESIKAGCDYIEGHIEQRIKNRATEAAALNEAEKLIKATPAYEEAVAIAHNETLAVKDCEALCACPEGEACPKADHVECKACMAGVSISGYCAGHENTPGCAAKLHVLKDGKFMPVTR